VRGALDGWLLAAARLVMPFAMTEPLPHPARVAHLRAELKRRKLTAFLVPRGDEFQGEYVAPHAERLRWLTNFRGSAGIAIVTLKKAAIFVWTSAAADRAWQVDGNLFERAGRVLLVDLKGSCPAADFDRLLTAFGWPDEALMVGLVRAGVFLDEPTFRRHATGRGAAGDGQTLRPR